MVNHMWTKLALTGILITGMAAAETLNVDTDKSNINWVGRKVTGMHEGRIQLQSGSVEFDDDRLVSGVMIMDMSSIVVDDITNKAMNKRLQNHLESDDFFGVDNHPTARFEITEAELVRRDGKRGLYEVQGGLTIKGITKSYKMEVWIARGEAAASAEGMVQIDRTDFDIRYKSAKFFPGMGDRAIEDLFDIRFELMTEVEGRNS